MKEKIRRAEKILDTIHGYVKGADQKISIFLALEGIILAILIPNYLKMVTARFQLHTMSLWNGLAIILATISLIYSIYEALNAIFPRLSNNKVSHLYFGSIERMKLQEYKTEMRDLREDEYFNELCEQIQINSIIVFGKHKKTQRAILFFLIGMGLFIISYVLLKIF